MIRKEKSDKVIILFICAMIYSYWVRMNSVYTAARSDLHIRNLCHDSGSVPGVQDHHEQRVHGVYGAAGTASHLVGLVELLYAKSEIVIPCEWDGTESLAVVGSEGGWMKDPGEVEVRVEVNLEISNAAVDGVWVVSAVTTVNGLSSFSPPSPELRGHLFSDCSHNQLWPRLHKVVHSSGAFVPNKLNRRRGERAGFNRERAVHNDFEFKTAIQPVLNPLAYSFRHVKRVILIFDEF